MLWLLSTLTAAACSSSAPPDPATCTMGAFWGDCGCGGEPKLACADDERGTCRWFVGGCVPVGYEASPCKVDNLCCRDDWPFEERTGWDTFKQLYGWGLEPWDAEREMNVSVQLDSGLEVEEMRWTCPEGGAPAICRGEPGMAREHFGGAFAFRLWDDTLSFAGSTPIIEVRRGDDPVARVCLLEFTDRVDPSCESLPRDPSPTCATAGTLTLSVMPEDEGALEQVHGTLTATFPEGVFEARF